jgi:putative addiction module antidote
MAVTTVKVRKIGNSLGVILPKEILEHLHVAEGDTLTALETDEGVQLRRSTDEFSQEFDEQMAAARRVMDRYRNTLRELAK